MYEGNLSDINGSSIEDKLSKTYEIFNLNHPEDFRGHSLSVSDVITLDDTNAYYVDSFGFKDFPAFFLEKTITIENVNSPLANNYISDKFYENRDTQSVTWMYYNPDGNDGNGQFVETVIYKEDIEAALKNANNSLNGIQAFMDTLYNCTQTITDRGTESFPAAEKYYNEAECDFSVEGNYNAALSDIRNYLTDYYNSFDNVPALTQDDIDILRTLEPRKSILNFTSEEIKLTEKWQQRFDSDIDKKSPYYRAVNGDWREHEATSVPVLTIEDRNADFKKVRDDIKSRVIERGSFINKDTNWSIQISRNGLEDTVKYGFTHNDTIIYNMIYDSSKLIENSILLDSVISEKNNNNKANNTAFMHKFYSLCSFNNEPYLAKITVEEFADGQADTLKRMYNIQDIKTEPLRHIEFTDKQLARSILNGSDISISDLFKIVKTCDNDFYLNKGENFLSYIRQENYDLQNYTIDSSGKLYDIPLILSDEQRKRFEAFGLIPTDEQRVINFSTDNKNWNKFQLRDKHGNRWKSVDMEQILSESEIRELHNIIEIIVEQNTVEQISLFDIPENTSEITEESKEIVWTPISETVDDNGKPTSYSTLYKGERYWISQVDKYKYDIEYDTINGIQAINEEFSGFSSRTQAEEFFEDEIDYFLELTQGNPTQEIPKIDITENYYSPMSNVTTNIDTDKLLTESIMRGSGFHDGKFRIYEFYHENNPNTKTFADFLKKEYGVGGRSGTEYIKFENYDSKGLELEYSEDNNLKKVLFNWNQVAKKTAEIIDNENYITDKDIAARIKYAEYILKNEKENVGHKHEYAEKVLKQYNIPIPANLINTVTDRTGNILSENQFANGESEESKEFNSRNFHIKVNSFEIGGEKTKFKANIAAIETLKIIEAQHRNATPEEQEIMSKYTGWGGLQNAFDNRKSEWSNEYSELRELLTDDEYDSAKASVLDAFYTPPFVIDSIYKALENMGFEGGKILDPATGIGNFLGKMPEKISEKSQITAVEKDSISGRIAKALYPNADVNISGFEDTIYPDNIFDVAVGNIPFGDFKLSDRNYDKHNFLIHDYFFAKAIDKVHPGGIIAFITSKGTLDKANQKVRKYISERADLIGAIRLPNNTFKSYAGTEVTSDIIFLQKREELNDVAPEWVYTDIDKNGFSVNSYFASHSEMILGETVEGNKLYGSKDTMVIPFENSDLKELLNAAVQNIKCEYKSFTAKKESTEKAKNILPANSEIQNYSFAEINGKIYYRENNIMTLQNLSGKKLARMKAMCDISKQLHKLIDMQLEGYPEETLQTERDELNLIYDKFTSEHGLLNEKVNADLFYRDVSAPLLLSLEKIKDGKLEEKSAIFTRTTLKPPQVITHAENSQDALIISISEKACVDMKFMQELTGKLEAELYADLKGDIFKEPLADNEEARYITADEYLSGNIREKLKAARLAAENSEEFEVNVKALEQAMPEPLEAGEISVQLGSAWVDSKYIEQFIREKLDIKDRYIDVKVHHNKYTASWNIENKSLLTHSSKIKSTEEYGTSRKSAAEIIENSLNMRDTSVYDVVYNADTDKEERVLNHDETLLARQKQTAIENEFKEWIFSDSDRRNALVEKYNILYNSVRQRQYNGENLKFDGMTTEIEMKPHQKDAIAHALYGGNTLFAHKVGAGKTFEMIAAAMEGKRLGLHNKSLIAVPNHMTRQFANDFFKLYPNANILVAEEKDFSKDNRRKLTAKIATGDFDAVIIGHSQLIKIPISREREEEYINRQIKEVVAQIETMKAEKGDSFTIKDMERTRKNLETKLDKLLSKPVRDNVVTFEQLGIDKLIIDEADMFKNLYINTKMRNLSGVATNESVQKTQDLYMKCQYLNEITDGKGIIFATGTPISNSISEAYVMQKYLNPKALDEAGLSHFDAWAANFAQKVTRTEFSPDGKGFRTKVRLAKFNNLPELMTMFKNFTDIKMAEDLNLPEPECERHTISVNATAIQKDLMQALGERAEKIHQKQVAPDVDNMLKITTDGTKIGLDQRLVNPILPDDPNSKVNICVDNVFKIYNDTKPERLTQVIFCDYSTPKADGSFSIYDDIKKKLIEKGIPEKEVAFIHDCKNNRQKEELFAKVRSGDVRIILGSTQKMGAGTNIQTKLYALHHLDPTWKPRDMEQRLGRMKRQGNENKKVHEYIYVTKDTFDANRYQTLEIKQGYISQIMTNHNPLRSCDDISPEEMSFAEVKAACVGNPLIKEKMELDIDIAQLQSLKSSYLKSHYRLEDSINSMPKKIESNLKLYENAVKDEAIAAAHPVRKDEEGNSIFNGITINGEFYSDKKQAGEALIAYSGKALIQNNYNNTPVGEYRGFKLVLRFDALSRETKLDVCGNNRYTINLSQSEIGNMTRIENAVNGIGSKAAEFKATAENIEKELAEAKIEFEKPFPQEQELKEKLARQSFLERELSKENEDILIDKQDSQKNEQEHAAQANKTKCAMEL